MSTALTWFRRDLRVADNAALYHALKNHAAVHCAFVFDTAILDALPRADRRVDFIRESIDKHPQNALLAWTNHQFLASRFEPRALDELLPDWRDQDCPMAETGSCSST